MPANWTRPFQLTHPLDARQVEEIDSMFQKLFSTIPLLVSRGGTGFGVGDLTTGDLLYADADDSLATLASVSAGSYLRSAGVETAPVWSTVKIPNADSTGDLWYGSATDTMSALALGAVGKILRSTGTLPAWSTFTIADTYAQGDLLYASATNTLIALVKDTNATRYLSNKGTSNAPQWSQVTLTNGVTGTLPVANGGTGLAAIGEGSIIQGNAGVFIATALGSAGAYLRAASGIAIWSTLILPNASAQGDIFISTATNNMTVLAKNASATRYLSNTGTSNNPAWAQVNLADGVTGDLPFANLVQASGASVLVGRGSAAGAGDFQEITLGSGLSMAGTVLSGSGTSNALLDASNHTDTVAQAVTRGSLIYGNATPAWDELVIGAANRLLRSDGTDVSWAQVALTTDVTGTLPVANGGTGVATVATNNLLTGNGTSALTAESTLTYDGTTLTLGSGQIAFPATQNASGGANTLDDYEEGTWTPTDASGAGLTLVNPSGTYIKIGQYVWVSGVTQYPVTADGSAAKLGGLPFTVIGTFGAGSPAFTNTSLDIIYYIRESSTQTEMFLNTGVTVTNAQLSGFIVEFAGGYRASA